MNSFKRKVFKFFQNIIFIDKLISKIMQYFHIYEIFTRFSTDKTHSSCEEKSQNIEYYWKVIEPLLLDIADIVLKILPYLG